MKSNFVIITFFISIGLLTNSCNKVDNSSSTASTGTNGSLSRFAISGDYLYAVSRHFLTTYSLQNPTNPVQVSGAPFMFDIETIYPYNKNLFIGTRTGLYIYSIDTPSNPRLVGEAHHARSCDPVVVNDSVAFVTLKSSSSCGPAVSGLYIHDIKNITTPVIMDTVPLPDPVGLGLQDSILYVCCGKDGLKVFNVMNPKKPKLLVTKSDANYVDVIPYNNLLICYISEGILLYDISKPTSPVIIKNILY